MKRSLLIISIIISGMLVYGQSYYLPSCNIRKLDGGILNASEIKPDSCPLMIIFWNASDNNCFNQIESILSAKEESLNEHKLKLIGICTGYHGDMSSVGPFVNGHDWEMEIYIDENGDLKRAMNISYLPYTMLFDNDMNLICQYAGYCCGSGEMMCEKVKACLEKGNKSLATSMP